MKYKLVFFQKIILLQSDKKMWLVVITNNLLVNIWHCADEIPYYKPLQNKFEISN